MFKNTSWLFWINRSQSQGTERIVINTNTPQKREPFDCDLGGRNEACSCGQRWLCMPRYIKSHSILFRAINILMRGKNQWFDMSIDFHKFQVVGRDQNGRYQASSYGESRVLISRRSIIKSIIWIIGRSVFQSKEQNRQYNHRECFQKIKSFSLILR